MDDIMSNILDNLSHNIIKNYFFTIFDRIGKVYSYN